MSPSTSTVLCRYRYDPLDRLASAQPAAQDSAQRFYRKNRLATQIQGAIQYTLFGHDDRLLAQQQRSGKSTETRLLATDLQGSVLHGVDGAGFGARAYTAYGHHPAESGLSCLMGFNGEHRDLMTGHYLLGNGHRAFNSVLLRFNSPDRLSPFGRGGLNVYAYCQGDPINFRDSTGRMPLSPRLLSGVVDDFVEAALKAPVVSNELDNIIESLIDTSGTASPSSISSLVESRASGKVRASKKADKINRRSELLGRVKAKELSVDDLNGLRARMRRIELSDALNGVLARKKDNSLRRWGGLIQYEEDHMRQAGHFKWMASTVQEFQSELNKSVSVIQSVQRVIREYGRLHERIYGGFSAADWGHQHLWENITRYYRVKR